MSRIALVGVRHRAVFFLPRNLRCGGICRPGKLF
jgi:hypothetical protein